MSIHKTSKTYRGHIVDVVKKELFDGEVVTSDGKIIEVKQCELPKASKPWPYLMPGFIDSHVHIESSMVTPQEFARVAMTHGTIGVVADPHEIANVLGVAGIDYMVSCSKQVPFNFCFGIPSCVPATCADIETNGATIDAAETERLMQRSDLGFLAEMMNYPGVLSGDQEVMRKIAAAHSQGKPVDGHAPGLTGEERRRYAAAGITTDHECATIEEGRSCIEAGMKVIIREGSAAKDYARLIPLLKERPDMVMFCTDDCHPDDLLKGHINLFVSRALREGYDLWDILQAACVNPQQHYHLNWGLLQEGDPATFIITDSLTPDFTVLKTAMAAKGCFEALPLAEADLRVDMKPGDTAHIICATDGSLLTKHETMTVAEKTDKLEWGLPADVQKIVVYNRYQAGAKPVVAWVKGFGLQNGAMASSVAHDSHNIVAIGSNDSELLWVINRVIAMHGGQVAVCEGQMAEVSLPIGGLMSPLSCEEVARRCEDLSHLVKKAGCQMRAPFITMAFLCLPVIPDIKITDKHLMDTVNMRKI